MTAPKLEKMKFWIVKPKAAINQIHNPTFAHPEFVTGWSAIGAGVTIAETGDEQRQGAYSMKVEPKSGTVGGAMYTSGLSVAFGKVYTFSCYVKGVAGQAMRLVISSAADTVKATKQFTATGYWQRVEVTHTAAENAAAYRAKVLRDAVASTAAFYVDGCQFEQDSKASTFFDGYSPGCRWTGAMRKSPSERSGVTGLGGELLCINDYARVISVQGFGNGQWNQILTKMTTGGDLYQTHIRKSRNISMVVTYEGNNQGDMQANRKVLLDALRPDLLSNVSPVEQFGINMPSLYRGHEQRIIRYQGFDANGNEATNPVDIVCVFQPSLNDTPQTPVFQKDVLNFIVPSGLFQGAYHDGKVLDLYANFPAEFIVKRDPQGNWCKWNGTSYDNSLKGQGTVQGLNGAVYCMAEGPDGKVYVGGSFTNAGGNADADYIARWNPVTGLWEALAGAGRPTSAVTAMVFSPEGDLFVGGGYIKRYTLTSGNPPAWQSEHIGVDFLIGFVVDLLISPGGLIYALGVLFDSGGAKIYGMAYAQYPDSLLTWYNIPWSEMSSGEQFNTITLAPNGDVFVGGKFTDLDGVAGATNLAKFDGTTVSAVSALNNAVYDLTTDYSGRLLAGGEFTDAGGSANADYIARWNGIQWEALGTGLNAAVRHIEVTLNEVYAAGAFYPSGGSTLLDRVAVWKNGAWMPLDINLPGTAEVRTILPASDGSLYIGGAFSTAGEDPDENAKTGVVALNFEVASASANTYPFMQIYGPGTLKAITNYTTGKSIMFDGLTLGESEWINLTFDPLQLSFRSGWAGRGNLMRYVVPGSDYGDFYVSPGANYLSLFMDGTTDGVSSASITYSPKFWGLDGALL